MAVTVHWLLTSPAVGGGEFQGWPEHFQEFFIGLRLDNSKRYFEANRKVYQESVRAPMEALLESLQGEFGPGKVFRPNRDIRFSADKSPYKTNIAADCGMGGHGGYVSLDAKGLLAAAGRYELDKEGLEKYRTAVAVEASGSKLGAIVDGLEKKGYELGGEDLKRVPPGFPADHPRARLLRHKRLYIWKSFGLQPWLGSAAARDRVAEVWRDARPLDDWFNRVLA